VVDEDRNNAETTVMLLQMWGHEAEPAYSAEDATSKAKALDPDVVLIDLERPFVNGFDLASELRAVVRRRSWWPSPDLPKVTSCGERAKPASRRSCSNRLPQDA
jgi:CheY-like chemotaxis protein